MGIDVNLSCVCYNKHLDRNTRQLASFPKCKDFWKYRQKLYIRFFFCILVTAAVNKDFKIQIDRDLQKTVISKYGAGHCNSSTHPTKKSNMAYKDQKDKRSLSQRVSWTPGSTVKCATTARFIALCIDFPL